MTDAEKIAAFIATRGVKKIPANHGTMGHLTRYDWANKVRGEPTTDELIAQRRVASVDHAGREVIVNGLGEIVSYG